MEIEGETVTCLKTEEDVKDLIWEAQALEKIEEMTEEMTEEMIETVLFPIKDKRSIFLFQGFRIKLKLPIWKNNWET